MTTASEPATPRQTSPRKKNRLNLLLVGLLLVFFIAAYFWYQERRNHVYEVDARITADSLTLSSRISGWVTAFHVIAGDTVRQGQLIAQIDDRETQLKLEETEAKIRSQTALIEKLDAEINLLTEQIENNYQRALNDRIAVSSKLSIAHDGLTQAREDFNRADSLLKQQLISKQERDRAYTAFKQAEDQEKGLQAELAASEAALASARAERNQITVLKKERIRLFREQEILQTVLEQQKIFLQDHRIASPISGVIDKTFVSENEFVSPGQRLVLMHDPMQVWVEANIKETAIRKLNVGQPVKLAVDAYPDWDLEGRVFRIGNATTSEFALLPSPNPSGNFTKITQRLPVRIEINDIEEEKRAQLRPGMMVEVDIAVK